MNTKYIIAIFKTRSYTYGFYNALKDSGIKCSIIDTPRQNFKSCGLSVKFLYKDLSKANEKLIFYKKDFIGYFKTNN